MVATVRVVNEPDGWTPHGDGIRRRANNAKFLMEPVAGGQPDDAPGKEVNDDGKVEPALACPDIGDVGTPFSGSAPAALKF